MPEKILFICAVPFGANAGGLFAGPVFLLPCAGKKAPCRAAVGIGCVSSPTATMPRPGHGAGLFPAKALPL